MANDHPIQNFIEDISKGVTTWHSHSKVCKFMDFVSQIEPKGFDDDIVDEHWSFSIQEELNQFEQNII